MPILAEADKVIASEAINAAPIRTIRLMQGSSNRGIAMSDTSSRSLILFHGGCAIRRLPALGRVAKSRMVISGKTGNVAPDRLKESWMNSPDIVEAALERAWSVYLLIHSGIDENDARRASLQRFIRQRCDAGETDTELLAVEGLKFLKSLEGHSED